MERAKKKHIFPIGVGASLLLVTVLLATTDIASPLIQYLHENSISPLAGAICILAGILGIYLVFRILVKLGNNLLPDGSEDEESKQT